MKNPLVIIGIVVVLIIGFVVLREQGIFAPAEKIYIAAEGDGKIVVVDPAKKSIITSIDLGIEHDGGRVPFYPHNVQVAPDGKSVWVTANSGKHEGHSGGMIPTALAHGEADVGSEPDEVIVINPLTDRIKARIQLDKGVQGAHVVVATDGSYAYASAQKVGIIYKINAKTFTIEKKIPAPGASQPHGMRISPDGKILYVALLTGQALGMLDTATDKLTQISMPGQAVQTGITPDGKTAMVSLYDSKQLALYRVDSKSTVMIDLPSTAQGPIQMYPTPDSKFVYLADQGYYFGQPQNDKLYKIEVATGKIVKEIMAGAAPHGVIVSQDGKFVYVTNLMSEDMSIIDTATDSEVGKITIGKEPNGISIWSKKLGGTP